MLMNAQKIRLKKIIFVSSGGTVYGIPRETPIPESHPTDPLCSYGISKLTIEKFLALFHKLHGVDYAVLRLANVYGERQRVVSSQGAVAVFLARVLTLEPIEIWGDGSVVRDYIHIDDVVLALLRVMGDTGNERVFNIGSGKGVSVSELLDTIERIVGQKTVRRHLPPRGFDVPTNILCVDRARTALGWQPRITLENGIQRFAEWMKQRETGLIAGKVSRP
jgi:UDP-glucose 4-epimerase